MFDLPDSFNHAGVWIFVGSVLLLVVGLVTMPLVILRLPVDYFSTQRSSRGASHRKGSLLLRIGRNIVGGVLLVAGIAMLVLPGQGILTLLAALMLLDFPGKRALLRRAFERPRIRRGLDYLREKFGREPFVD